MSACHPTSPGLHARYEVHPADEDTAAAPEAEDVTVSVEIDVGDWVLLVEYHLADAYLMAVEQWAADGAGGDPPQARAVVARSLGLR